MEMPTKERAEELIRALMIYPELAFSLATALQTVAGPWVKRSDTRSMVEWVRMSPSGSTVARVWMDTDMHARNGHWRGQAGVQRHLIDKDAEPLKNRVDVALRQQEWILVG